jgi:parallel beta-helix repeat protein
MLDPGGASTTQVPSTDNLLENNLAYGNEGHGLRILASNQNTVRGNQFYQNTESGISIEDGSTANQVVSNQLNANNGHGLVLRGSADSNIVSSNVISANVSNGIYIRSSNNVVNGNTISGNQAAGIALTPDTDPAVDVQNNQVVSNTITSNVSSGIDAGSDKTTQVTGTLIENNLITNNGVQGIAITNNANQSKIMRNIVRNNTANGILMSGVQAFGNTWSANQIYANTSGGIAFTNNVNPNITAPTALVAEGCQLSGTTRAGSTVEVFSDDGNQGRYYHGQATADTTGAFTFRLNGRWLGGQITTVATDAQGNSSPFSAAVAASTGAACEFNYLPLVTK